MEAHYVKEQLKSSAPASTNDDDGKIDLEQETPAPEAEKGLFD